MLANAHVCRFGAAAAVVACALYHVEGTWKGGGGRVRVGEGGQGTHASTVTDLAGLGRMLLEVDWARPSRVHATAVLVNRAHGDQGMTRARLIGSRLRKSLTIVARRETGRARGDSCPNDLI